MSETATTSVYLITLPRIDDLTATAEALKRTLDVGGVSDVQLRLKSVDDDTVRRAADALRDATQQRGVRFIMNDRPDLAHETGCDGVHVGQEDMSCRDARELLGDDAVIGVTCKNSLDLARTACADGADNVAFGAFFGSSMKESTTRADVDNLRHWSQKESIPCVAIGGITPKNCTPLVRAGAAGLAVISAVWNHTDGPEASVREFLAAIAAA